jgi:hypothetical protein
MATRQFRQEKPKSASTKSPNKIMLLLQWFAKFQATPIMANEDVASDEFGAMVGTHLSNMDLCVLFSCHAIYMGVPHQGIQQQQLRLGRSSQ